MAKNCPPDIRQEFMGKYLEPLLESDFWKELIIADPSSSMTFISNLVEIFDAENFKKLSKNIVHFRIAVAAAAVYTKPTVLYRTRKGFGEPKLPDPTMIERFRSVKNSYEKDHYHTMFKDLTSWHIQFIDAVF